MLYKENDNAIIIINKSHPLVRQRFTSAHEVAHLFYGHGGRFLVDRGSVVFRDSTSSTGEIDNERKANSFAAKLLMPVIFLSKDVGKNIDLIDLEKIESLARKYKVSVQAMTYRLTNLGWID
jgi:Zn-dependent peptidase ImmA (M78 family)